MIHTLVPFQNKLLTINTYFKKGDSFLKETLNNKETKPIQKISETDQNSNEFENRTLGIIKQ